MKLGHYNEQVQLNTIDGNTSVSSDQNAYGGNTSGLQEANNFLNLAIKTKEDDEAVNVTAANLEYTKRLNDVLNNQDNGLMNTQQNGSSGITQNFQEQEAKIRQDVAKEFNVGNYRKSQMAFDNLANRDAASRFELVRKHEYEQKEAYKNTTLSNQQQEQATYAIENYSSDQAITNSVAAISQSIMLQYGSQGEEVVKQKQREALQGMLVGTATAALNSGDTDRAEAIMDKAGSLFPLAQRVAIGSQVAKQNRENTALQLNKSLYEKYKNDPAGLAKALAEIDANASTTSTGGGFDVLQSFYNETQGMPYKLGGPEDGSGDTYDCGSWTRMAMRRAGVELDNRCADMQAVQMKHEGKFYTDENNLKQGDLVFWTGTGGEEGEYGIAHVGIYAGGGKVWQSGTNGVAPIDLHTYEVVGYGATGLSGGTRKLSPTEIEAKKQSFATFWTKQESIASKVESNIIDQGRTEILNLMNSGDYTSSDLQAIVNKYSNGNDKISAQLGRYVRSARNAETRVAAKAGKGKTIQDGMFLYLPSGTVKLTAEADAEIRDKMARWNLSNNILDSKLADLGMPASLRSKYLKINDGIAKSGRDWSEIADWVRSDGGISIKNYQAMKYGMEYIREERRKGNDPSDEDVVNAIISAGNEKLPSYGGINIPVIGKVGAKKGIDKLTAYARKGVIRVEPIKAVDENGEPSTDYLVQYDNGSLPTRMSEEEYKEEFGE